MNYVIRLDFGFALIFGFRFGPDRNMLIYLLVLVCGKALLLNPSLS